jgi:hypothetical protein
MASVAGDGTEDGKAQTELELEVSKSFLDGRFTVMVSSSYLISGSDLEGDSKASLSDFSSDIKLYYDISKEGAFKLKAYRVHDYDVFEGNIVNTGAGILFEKDLDSFRKKKNKVNNSSSPVEAP